MLSNTFIDQLFESRSFDIELGDNSDGVVTAGIDTDDKSNDLYSSNEGCKKEACKKEACKKEACKKENDEDLVDESDAGSEEDEADNEVIDSVDESMIDLIIDFE